MLRGRELIEQVAHKRLAMISDEVDWCYPGAKAAYEIGEDGRCHIAVHWGETLIGEEYVETATSWSQPERMEEYRKVLKGNKRRLVVLVPEHHARSARLKMLELNHWWLFYYLVFSYDHEGEIRKVGRPIHCFPDAGYA